VSRLSIVTSSDKAYSGKEVILIAGERSSMKVLVNVFYVFVVATAVSLWSLSDCIIKR
jgi:hypothetical protein